MVNTAFNGTSPSAGVRLAGPDVASATASPTGSSHLTAVDGLRGLAALAIVIYHLFTNAQSPELRIAGINILRPLHDGWAGVNLFLVLSGFCLFWPYARDPNRRLTFGDYLGRRIRRIVPAYYASLLLIPFIYWFLEVAGISKNHQVLPRSIADVFLHLTLLHSLFAETIRTWNGVTWSLGLEWTWYLLFPLALWLFRRTGAIRGLLVLTLLTVAYRVGLYLWFGPGDAYPLTEIEWTFALRSFVLGRLFEFSIGMYVASRLAQGKVRPYTWAFAIVACPLVLLAAHRATPTDCFLPVRDMLYGVAGGLLLLAGTTPGHNPVRALLSSRFLKKTGECSYSLYLLHMPIVVCVCELLSRTGVHGPVAFLFSFIALPVILLMSRVAYHSFEEPFMRHSPRAPAYGSPKHAYAGVVSD